jgi:hypothetical protein
MKMMQIASRIAAANISHRQQSLENLLLWNCSEEDGASHGSIHVMVSMFSGQIPESASSRYAIILVFVDANCERF